MKASGSVHSKQIEPKSNDLALWCPPDPTAGTVIFPISFIATSIPSGFLAVDVLARPLSRREGSLRE